ncbi:PREDICTED: coiled-coil domain-containing protein 43 isoform X2 [Cyprinodon variegatus]|uniref:coiled-coil domain-containing protein 43 isoform X2 n=1 Tax=Cyprinodon variegatus TaxID=28743 RepID=UPI000742B71B|nr:PREDICTED: coiled-coil domain-containing protein 43 isoform X2 [Cyprinodon variegatus]
MAAPMKDAGEFESWLDERLDSLEVDREVYSAYILGILKEEESDEEKEDALQGILSAFLDEDTIEEVCKQIINHWKECCSRLADGQNKDDAEVQAIASMIEKQAQIVVKQKDLSEESKKRKEALLAQYANVTDEEDEAEEEPATGIDVPALFRNTNVEEVLSRQKQKRDQAREDAQKKKEMDKMQREKDKLAKQDRKEKEKKRTQKGERKR